MNKDYSWVYCVKCGSTHIPNYHKQESIREAIGAGIAFLFVMAVIVALAAVL